MINNVGHSGCKLLSAVLIALVWVVSAAKVAALELQSGEPVSGTIASSSYSTGDFIVVPAGAERLDVELEGDSTTKPDVDLYLKFGRSVNGSDIQELNADADFYSDSFGHTESLTVTPREPTPFTSRTVVYLSA